MNLSVILDVAADTHESRAAIGPSPGVTYAELADDARRAAGVLAELDAGCVAFLGQNGPLLPTLLFATGYTGLPFVPLNFRLGRRQLDELVAQLDKPYVIADEEYIEVARASADRVTATQDFAAAIRGNGARVQPRGSDAPAVILFTSGTTAVPKAATLRHDHLCSYIFRTVEPGSAERDDAALVCVPPYHVAGVSAVLSNVFAGRRIVYLKSFDPAAWLRLVRDERVTNVMLVPTMLARIVGTMEEPLRGCSLRLITYGGARMPSGLLRKAIAMFPETGFCNAYGLTETSSTICILSPEDHREAMASDDPQVRAHLASVGRPIPGVEIEVRQTDGSRAESGVVGEFWVRGPQVAGDYLSGESATDGDGWFRSKDHGAIDDAGYVFVHGRVDDTIIRGGENIAPGEIEDVLTEHLGVAEASVVGFPDEEWGEIAVAAVVAAPDCALDTEELRAYVRGKVRGSRTPDRIVVWPDLPKTGTEKVMRREVVERLRREFVTGEVDGGA